MSYLDTFKKELNQKLEEGDNKATIEFVVLKMKVNYYNGVRDGLKGDEEMLKRLKKFEAKQEMADQ